MPTLITDRPQWVAEKTTHFGESVIREMSRYAARFNATNLAQGLPDFPCPDELKDAACHAIQGNINQYSFTWGDTKLRQAIVDKTERSQGLQYDIDTEVTVTCGAAEALNATLMGLINPGDEVIILEPFYENYIPNVILAGGVPKFVKLNPIDWSIDSEALAAAFNDKTKVILLNSPHNPTGRVFDQHDLNTISALCEKYNVVCVTDEIYEHILYDGAEHICMARVEGMRERTVVINALSKSYSITGWRIGYVLAPPAITHVIRKVHDFLTVCAPAPLQRAGVTALNLPDSYYSNLQDQYNIKRDTIMKTLTEVGINFVKPSGAYYILGDISRFNFATDTKFCEYLAEEIGVAMVPGSGFYSHKEDGYKHVRICYSKSPDTLAKAHEQLLALNKR
jgi:aminotransferase